MGLAIRQGFSKALSSKVHAMYMTGCGQIPMTCSYCKDSYRLANFAPPNNKIVIQQQLTRLRQEPATQIKSKPTRILDNTTLLCQHCAGVSHVLFVGPMNINTQVKKLPDVRRTSSALNTSHVCLLPWHRRPSSHSSTVRLNN